MLIRDCIPAPAVQEFVQFYRIVHFEFGPSECIPFKAYPPKPEQVLHFFLRDPVSIENAAGEIHGQPLIVFVGQSTSMIKLINGSNLLNVQIVFQPMAVFRLTSIPAHELTNQHIDGTCMFKKNIKTTFSKLQSARSYHELIQILNGFVLELISQSRLQELPIDIISRQMIKSGGNVSVDFLAEKSFLCIRQFRRKFYEAAGVNPKTYLRIIHFNKAYNFKNWHTDRDWARVAAECGYTDYQHLAKDYQEFSGMTPPKLHFHENNSPENMLGIAKNLYRHRLMATR